MNTSGWLWKNFAVRALPEEFRRDMVEIAHSSREPRRKIAEDFVNSSATLSNWLKADEIETVTRDGVARNKVRELRQLRRRNRLLEQENEVVRRAAAYLSQANLKLDGS